MAVSLGMHWNEGEEKMHKLFHVPEKDNPTSATLTPQAVFMLQRAPLLAIGTLDSQDRPWTTVLGGTPGFSQPLGGNLIGTSTIVDGYNDPVVQALVGHVAKREVVQGDSKMIAALAIDLMTRKRVKIAGRLIARSLGEEASGSEDDSAVEEGLPDKQDQLQLVYKVEQSLGNCPKYLNQFEVRPSAVKSKVMSQSPSLSNEAKELISKAEMFFLSTGTSEDMDTNHRGGPAGFVRVLSDTEIVYPEYSGNRLYQSLGNLLINPRVGITFPDYETGNVLYLTGTTEVLALSDAAKLLPGSNLALRVKIEEARLVESGLPFRGIRKTPSPYNPQVRTLASEGNIKSRLSESHKTARLIKKRRITPTISAFTFSVPEGITYAPGQWVALDFSRDMDQGYSHMRNDDPRSLNDDFIRTFTISSTPKTDSGTETQFEITIREVGPVTKHLFRQNDRAGFEVPVVGVGGEFTIEQEKGKMTPFVAGGVGITPLLGQVQNLNLSEDSFRLVWTARRVDIGLVVDTLQSFPRLVPCTHVYFTGTDGLDSFEEDLNWLSERGVKTSKRRLESSDIQDLDVEPWYICAGGLLRTEILKWLGGKKAIYEDFNF